MAYLTSLGPGDLFLDVGSGDGAACSMAALMCGCFALGVEIVPSRYIQSACLLERLRYELQLKAGVPKSQLPPLPPAAGGGPWPARIGNLGKAVENEATVHSLATLNVSTLVKILRNSGSGSSSSSGVGGSGVFEGDFEDFVGAGTAAVTSTYTPRQLNFNLAKEAPGGGTHKLCREAGFSCSRDEAVHSLGRLWLGNVHRVLTCGLQAQVLRGVPEHASQQTALAKRRCQLLDGLAHTAQSGGLCGSSPPLTPLGDSGSSGSSSSGSTAASASSQMPFGSLLHSASDQSEQGDVVDVLSDDDSDVEVLDSSKPGLHDKARGKQLTAGPSMHGRRGYHAASTEVRRYAENYEKAERLRQKASCPGCLFGVQGKCNLDSKDQAEQFEAVRRWRSKLAAVLGPRSALPPPPSSSPGHPWMSAPGTQVDKEHAKRVDARLRNDGLVSVTTWSVFRASGDAAVRAQQLELGATGVHASTPAPGWGWLSDTDEEVMQQQARLSMDSTASSEHTPSPRSPGSAVGTHAAQWLSWLKYKRAKVFARTQELGHTHALPGLTSVIGDILPGLNFLAGSPPAAAPMTSSGPGAPPLERGGGTFSMPYVSAAPEQIAAASTPGGIVSAVCSALLRAAGTIAGTAVANANPPQQAPAQNASESGAVSKTQFVSSRPETTACTTSVATDSLASFPKKLFSVKRQPPVPTGKGPTHTIAGAGAALSIISADTTDAPVLASGVGSLDTCTPSADTSPGASTPSLQEFDQGSTSAGCDSSEEESPGPQNGTGLPPWRIQPAREDPEWHFGWPYRSMHPRTAAQLPHGMLPQLARARLLSHPQARQFAERFGVSDLPEHEKVAFVCGDALSDGPLGLSPQALGLARVVFVNNYDGLWQQDNFQNKVYLKLTRHMRRGSILVSCTPFFASRHSSCVLTDRGKVGEGRDVYTKANLSLMVHGGGAVNGWRHVDTALLWVQQSSGEYTPRSAEEKRALAACIAAEEDAGGSGQLIDDAVQVCNDVWRAGESSDVFNSIQCRLQGFLLGQVCEPWQSELGMNSATGVQLRQGKVQSARKRPRAL